MQFLVYYKNNLIYRKFNKDIIFHNLLIYMDRDTLHPIPLTNYLLQSRSSYLIHKRGKKISLSISLSLSPSL